MSFKTIKYILKLYIENITLARDKLTTSSSSISGRQSLDANLMRKFTSKLTLKSIHRYVERIDL